MALLGSAQLQNLLQGLFPVRLSHALKDVGKMPLLSMKRALESQMMDLMRWKDLKGHLNTSAHFLTKKTIFVPESMRTEFQAAIYQDSVFEFLFIFLILLWVVFLNFNDVTFARENIFSNKSHQNLHQNLIYCLTLISVLSTAAVSLQVSSLCCKTGICSSCSTALRAASGYYMVVGHRGIFYFCS